MGDLYTIVQLTNSDPAFYPTLGPYLSQRSIVKELGYAVWDDPGKRWWVALDETGAVLGFVAARDEQRGIVLTSDWVRPEVRRKGIYRQLFAERLAWLNGQRKRAEATATPAASPLFAATAGFRHMGSRGRYQRYEWTPGEGRE